ncbi:MAG TPA: TetR/AcrR family transcriptional regulator [Gemmatimonadales bacterium]|nr:TetR/AcrR family transcriptional regulator [Gemmatimonadales bacterium]
MSPPPGRRERKKQEVRRRIYEAAFALFVEKGFDATTVDQIAERADVGKGTVFNYFPRKTSLLGALAVDWTERLIEEFGPVATWRGDTRAQLERAFRFLADLGTRNPALSRLALAESLRRMHGGGDAPGEDEGPIRHFQDITRSVLRRGQERGDVRPDVDPDYAAELIESAFFRAMAHRLRGGTRATMQHGLAVKLDVIFAGLGGKRSGRSGRSRRTGAGGREGGWTE